MKKCIDRTRNTPQLRWPAFLLMAALLVLAPGFVNGQQPGATSASPPGQPDVLQKEGGTAPSTSSYTLAEREAYQRKVASELDEMQQKIGELRIKSRTVVQQKKHMLIKATIDLQRMTEAARHRLTALEAAPKKDWEKLKVDMDKAMANLNTSYQEVKAQF